MNNSLAPIHLGSGSLSVVISQRGKVPSIVYWGSSLGDGPIDEAMFLRPVLSGGSDLDPPLGLIPQQRDGWSGLPGLEGFHLGGKNLFAHLQLTSFDCSATKAIIDLADNHTGLAAQVSLEINDAEVLVISAKLTNNSSEKFVLGGLRLALPVPANAEELLTYTGRWGLEFCERRTSWLDSVETVTNLRGKTSHEKWPLVFAGTRAFSDEVGEVWGCHLGWSGNYEIVADSVTDHHRHILLGERLFLGEVVLESGQSYETPKIYAVHSTFGLNGASQKFHQHVRTRAKRESLPRPVILNTWEAVYFNHDFTTLKKLADIAAEVGVERFVLDDGWFKGRRNDKAGLGDWTIDPKVWPDGLKPLIDHVENLGMDFGLWFEPEMVNPDSDLYRRHPDWALHDDNYQQLTGRNQLVLDMSRHEVVEYLFKSISDLLTSNKISFIKWDHNRDLHAAKAHAQTRATYDLLARLRKAHPHVQFESCAAGGGRIDFGVLEHVDRFWTSDSIDALDRVGIQRGASRLMPPEFLGMHIGAETNSITRRSHELAFRATTALFGWLGVEMNLLALTPDEIAELREVVTKYKSLRPLLHSGVYFNVDHPDSRIVAHGVRDKDCRHAIVSVTRTQNSSTSHIDPIRVAGLSPTARYSIAPVYFGEKRNFALHRKLPDWLSNPTFMLTGRQLEQLGFVCPPLLPASSFVVAIERARS